MLKSVCFAETRAYSLMTSQQAMRLPAQQQFHPREESRAAARSYTRSRGAKNRPVLQGDRAERAQYLGLSRTAPAPRRPATGPRDRPQLERAPRRCSPARARSARLSRAGRSHALPAFYALHALHDGPGLLVSPPLRHLIAEDADARLRRKHRGDSKRVSPRGRGLKIKNQFFFFNFAPTAVLYCIRNTF